MPSIACLGLAVGLLWIAVPTWSPGGVPLPVWAQGALAAAALAAGAWGALSARAARVLVGSVAAAALLAAAADPRLPTSRLPLHVAAAVLLLLHVELALLHAKVARLARLPRAHVTQVGKAREVELRATAQRIVGAWPKPLAGALVVLAAALALQGLAGSGEGAPWGSVEVRGPFGLALAAVVVLGAAGFLGWRRLRAQEPGGAGGSGGPAGSSDGGAPAPGR